MNDFIIWDKTLKCFHMDGRVKFENGILKPIGEDHVVLKAIGLKDINNNKIYANSSIVEYSYIINNKHFNRIGFASYNIDLCCYCMATFDGFNTTIAEAEQLSLLIIDTIQENKLGLIN